MSDSPLYDELMDEIERSFPLVENHLDTKQGRSRCAILKINGQTIGYVNGRKKYRIGSPGWARQDGKWPSVLICNRYQIPVAIEFLSQYIPEEAAT